MKRFMIASLVLFASHAVFAQPPGGPKNPPPAAERWTHDSKKMEALNLGAATTEKVKAVFMNFYKDMDALREKNKGTRPPKEEMDKLEAKRNAEVKKLMNAQQFEAFSKLHFGPPKRKHGDHPSPNKNAGV